MAENQVQNPPAEKVIALSASLLEPFQGHPFQVASGEEMEQLKESIREYGVLSPLLVRPRGDGRYEIVSGHRRKAACEALGITELPVLVREMTDDEAVILMVDSNIQREHILPRVAFSGSSYEPDSAIFTSIAHDEKGQLGKVYSSSNWVVFVDPKVDLSFFQSKDQAAQDLMIIHYSDQYTSTSGYDDITVTQKSQQYEEIIRSHLNSKGISATKEDVHNIISLFNAVNGDWMLRLIPAKKLAGAVDSNFSREKMSILSAIKLCMAYYAHEDIVWIPISLEEMLRVSRGAGYSQSDGLLSAKNLGFEKGATSDDVLMVGIEGPVNDIKIYLHPVEVKIGQNAAAVLSKAQEQVLHTYAGLWNALWPDENRDSLECKLSRNFLMQLVIVSCEKMCLYNVYPDVRWEKVLEDFREALLNEQYTFSKQIDSVLGKGTIISFKTDVLNKSGSIQDDICILELPEKMGSEYMIKSAAEIEKELDSSTKEFPDRLSRTLSAASHPSTTRGSPGCWIWRPNRRRWSARSTGGRNIRALHWKAIYTGGPGRPPGLPAKPF